MRKQLQEFRDNLICKVWENNRAIISMEDLSEIFDMSIPQIYRVIKKGREAQTSKNNK